MEPLLKTSSISWYEPDKIGQIVVQLNSKEVLSSTEVVQKIASIKGAVDVYCWYEGAQGICKKGALFMRDFFQCFFKAKGKEAKLFVYSLKSWDLSKRVSRMPPSTDIGNAINQINRSLIECLFASSFFQYCKQVPRGSSLYNFINEELPKKLWLYELSGGFSNGISIEKLFDNQDSLFNCIKTMPAVSAYALMQYVEAYYLIRESVERKLSKGDKKITVAFALPNDEGDFYKDLPADLEVMLRLEFGVKLTDVEINVSFYFFKYGESDKSRPYIEKDKTASKVTVSEIPSYFDFISKQIPPFIRGDIHGFR